MSDSPPQPRYEIQGRQVTLPCRVRDAASGAATYLVRSAPARALVPDAFEVAEVLPGRTLLSLALIDYRDNDLGDYDEVSIAFFVRPKGAGKGIPYLGSVLDFLRQRLGTFVWKLPVDQAFTCEAGRTIWGFPKTVDEIDIIHEEGRCTGRLAMDGRHVLTLCVPRGGCQALPEREMTTYTLINGVPHRTASSLAAEGFGAFAGRRSQLELGDHPIAGTLRRLGLPRKPILCAWNEHMRARFDAPEKIPG